jgi:hypothetical protein
MALVALALRTAPDMVRGGQANLAGGVPVPHAGSERRTARHQRQHSGVLHSPMNTEEKNFCKLLDAYFDALVRGGTQTRIDEARLAIIAEHNRQRNEVDDLRGFIDGMSEHVKAVAAMYGYTAHPDLANQMAAAAAAVYDSGQAAQKYERTQRSE